MAHPSPTSREEEDDPGDKPGDDQEDNEDSEEKRSPDRLGVDHIDLLARGTVHDAASCSLGNVSGTRSSSSGPGSASTSTTMRAG
jgi:hypothetical protein